MTIQSQTPPTRNAESTPATPEVSRAKQIIKALNPLMKAMLRSPLHGLMSKQLMVLDFRGRKTGNRYSIPVGYHPQPDGTLLVFTESPWWRNLQDAAPVIMRLRGRNRRGTADAITDRAFVMQQVQDFLRREGVKNARRIGLTLDPSHEPTPAELESATRNLVLVHIRLI